MKAEEIDQQLVRRAQAGEEAAFESLYLQYQNKIRALANRYIRDSQEADDIVQEAFIKAYRSLGQFRGGCTFYTWLYRITINVSLNHISSRSRRLRTSVQMTDADVGDGELAPVDISGPEQTLESEQLAIEIRNTIQSLPEALKNALTLREHYGLSYAQIANITNCPIGTVRSRISRAREAIDIKISPLLAG